jgi:hypothetical protein
MRVVRGVIISCAVFLGWLRASGPSVPHLQRPACPAPSDEDEGEEEDGEEVYEEV